MASSPAHDDDRWLDGAIARAHVRATEMAGLRGPLSPTDDYPATSATVWCGSTLAERQAQMRCSRGFFCGEHYGDIEEVRDGEILRFSTHHRCSVCSEPTLWFHFADEARTRAGLASYD